MDVFGYFLLNEIMKIYDNYDINCGTRSSGLIGSFFNKEFCVSLTFLLKTCKKNYQGFFYVEKEVYCRYYVIFNFFL